MDNRDIDNNDIAGPWHKVKRDFIAAWKGPDKGNNYVVETIAEVEARELYQDDDLLTVGEYFKILDMVLERGKEASPGESDITQLGSFISTASSKLYQGFRDKFASGAFDTSKDWPEATIEGKDINSKVQLAPDVGPIVSDNEVIRLQEVMREKVIELSKQGDLAADVFDIITSKWLREARNHDSMIDISVDEILEARGLKQKGRGGGVYSGYDDDQRAAVVKHVEILSYAWIQVFEMEVTEIVKGKRKRTKWRGESKALNVSSRFGQVKLDGRVDPHLWHIRPGDVFSKFLFGPGRQTALLSCKALEYDYYKQKWEKRLTRYICWQWRIDERQIRRRVATLIEAIEENINKRFPKRTKDRLEKALDQLQADGVIKSWKYEKFNPGMMSRRGWWKQWQDCIITFTAPQDVLNHYSGVIANRIKHKQLGGGKGGSKKQN